MSELNDLFRKRIGFPAHEKLTFDKLDGLLVKLAYTIPFENLCIIENRKKEITIENLIHKILHKNEGGLCYELNAILYLFLLDNGFDVSLVQGTVYKSDEQQFSSLRNTHAAILLNHENELNLIDSGFGGSLPLKPVHMNGEIISSSTGQFRVKPITSEYGDQALELKLKHKDNDWRIGYVFDSTHRMNDVADLNTMQTVIAEHPQSSFTKNPLITRLTKTGGVTLTSNSLTEWADGNVTKEEIDLEKYKALLQHHFGIVRS